VASDCTGWSFFAQAGRVHPPDIFDLWWFRGGLVPAPL